MAFGLWLAVFFVLAASATFPALRFQREQSQRVIQNRALALGPVVQALHANAEEELGLGSDDLSDQRPLQALLRTVRMDGLIDLQLIDAEGFPISSVDSLPFLSSQELSSLALRKPSASFSTVGSPARWELTPGGPMLEVLVPLFRGDGRFAGVAAYLLDGSSLAEELDSLAGQTIRLAGAVFLIGLVVFSILWAWAWKRLESNRRELAERNSALGRLNRELALLAKTSAVGALTSHLMHGLKNPLAGLREFTRRDANDTPDQEEWSMARESTLRMSEMIDETIAVLREENTGDAPELGLAEILSGLLHKHQPAAQARGATFVISPAPPYSCSGLRGRLLGLILANLVDNALAALPAQGGAIRLEASIEDGTLVCRVRDNGPGLSHERASRPFEAAPSTKPGGSGLGLALSRLLAIPAQAELALQSTSPQGTCFSVRLPPQD